MPQSLVLLAPRAPLPCQLSHAVITVVLVTIALALGMTACVDSEFSLPDTTAADSALSEAISPAADGSVGADPGVSPVDTTADTDLAGTDAAPSDACSGGIGCACTEDSACAATGVCTVTPSGKKCAAFCVQGSCEAGFGCGAAVVQAAGGQPTTKNGICLHRWASECAPCNSDAACPVAGDPNAACVDPTGGNGDNGNFCAPSCTQTADCPPNRGCEERPNLAGVKAKYCVPPDGQCICSPYAVSLSAATSCTTAATGIGICKGQRLCTQAGLQPCSAATPIAEVCNGTDDDCDGQIDESSDVTPICDDDNTCTTDSCKGKDGCGHDIAEGNCSDNDACTASDACAAGKCVGTAVNCDDINPCTADACDKVEGCTHASLAGNCDDADACTEGEVCVDGLCGTGTPLPCSDGNPCTSDLCQANGGCVFLPEAGTCSDGNSCTGVDTCKGGTCVGPLLACDDGWGCTLDTCDPSDGCSFKPQGGTCGQAKVPYKIEFYCNDNGFSAWKVTAPGIGLATPKPPLLAWKVDDSPALGGTSQCALNVNNGADLVCGFGQTAIAQTADSPWLDATAIAPLSPLLLRFESAGLWSSSVSAKVLVRGEVGAYVELVKLPPSAAVWGKVTLNLATWVGKTFQLRFELSSADCSSPAGVGWYVRKLELAVDPCALNNGGCSKQATCAPSGGPNALCTCLAGWAGDGKSCTDIDECKNGSSNCATSAACINSPGSFSCGCAPGLTGNGTTCTDIDECATGTAKCAADAACTNTLGSFACKCKAGFAGDGTKCTDIDECATNNGGCAASGVCTNAPGTFQCTCKPGFIGDGKLCNDVNECASVALSGCAAAATCANTPGAHNCSCKPGYLGDGKTCLLYGSADAPASSCKAILALNPASPTGDYYLVLAGGLVQVQCDMVSEGGGWTVVAYKANLPYGGFNFQKTVGVPTYLATDFQTVMTPAQIKALQAISTEGRQTYVGQCNRMVHYFYAGQASYNYGFGFRFADGSESVWAKQSYAPLDITITADGCKDYVTEGGSLANATIFKIKSSKVPVINVKYTIIVSYAATKFGSPLLTNPAQLR